MLGHVGKLWHDKGKCACEGYKAPKHARSTGHFLDMRSPLDISRHAWYAGSHVAVKRILANRRYNKQIPAGTLGSYSALC